MDDSFSVAILSINIGNYISFWKEFYESAKLNLFPSMEKVFYVFTDHKHIEYEENEDVNIVFQEDLGWPDNTLMRFEMFCRIEEDLKDFDYVLFANANLFFFQEIDEHILPRDSKKLFFVRKDRSALKRKMPYETNPISKAYVDEKEELYVRGGFNGGTAEAFLSMCRTLRDNINIDKENGIVAVWHDESHITRYAIDHHYEAVILFPGYLYPEGWVMPYEKKILIRPKDNDAVRFGKRMSRKDELKKRLTLTLRNALYTIIIALHLMEFEEDNLN